MLRWQRASASDVGMWVQQEGKGCQQPQFPRHIGDKPSLSPIHQSSIEQNELFNEYLMLSGDHTLKLTYNESATSCCACDLPLLESSQSTAAPRTPYFTSPTPALLLRILKATGLKRIAAKLRAMLLPAECEPATTNATSHWRLKL